MKSVPKLIGRCIRILLFSFILLVILNLVLFILEFTTQKGNGRPWICLLYTSGLSAVDFLKTSVAISLQV